MWQEEVGAALAAGFGRLTMQPDDAPWAGPSSPDRAASGPSAPEPWLFRAQRPTARTPGADYTSAAPVLLARRLGRPDVAGDLAVALAAQVRAADGVADAWARDGHVALSVTPAALAGVVDDLLGPGSTVDTPPGSGADGPPGPVAGADRPPGTAGPPEALARFLPGDAARAGPARLAHARARNLTRVAHAHRVRPWPAGIARRRALAALVDEPGTRELILCLAGSRAAVARARETGRPDPVFAHLARTAAAHRAWYEVTRVTPRGDGAITSAHRSRLCLNDATTPVLAGGLAVLGLDAPEHL
ncbi:hypothetical protein EXU48_07310 [Occultella glacieicola]|uniref:DALR anticodon binding domain-containing protein n=1 Tax=Occultella glacieicola TaxID=2518684 RepID=A0ABY2E7L8_9MICO|nr:DALR anticodon-binding domain-containing protein [Occultella glacieicola]TDE96039.1 hypothetical protein EXU48_07310 [Occultella glacieicola]